MDITGYQIVLVMASLSIKNKQDGEHTSIQKTSPNFLITENKMTKTYTILRVTTILRLTIKYFSVLFVRMSHAGVDPTGTKISSFDSL